MKLTFLLGALLIFSGACCLAAEHTSESPHGTDPQHTDTVATMKTASHSLGLFFGKNIATAVKELDFEQLIQGFKESFGTNVPQEKLQQANTAVQEFLRTQQLAKTSAALARSNTYLQENAKKPGVKTTTSGLQYEIIKAGKGRQPKADDQVTVHYRGTLTNGTEFDNSYSRGQPTTFQLGNVIPGWTEGLQLMQEGSRFKFAIPPALGYGEGGAGQNIGPNEALVFEIELIKIGTAEPHNKKPK